jgi:hypothetical protein
MPDKNEKERRRQIMDKLRKKADEEFELNIPMSQELFKKLFDYLDKELTDNDCDNTLKLTEQFLTDNKIISADKIIEWLVENGGGCDCEVLANVEEMFEK